MNKIAEINYNEMYQNTKKRMSFESKKIRQLLLYNYINDDLESIIIDCRDETSISIPKNVKENTRLILILNDNETLKDSKALENVRTFIKNEDNISKGLFYIFNSDYKQFCKDYPFYNDHICKIEPFHLPLCVLNQILYIGNFINSKNKKTLSLLKPKCIISLMKEPDKEFSELYKGHYRNFKHEEANHDEIEFEEIYHFILEEIEGKNTPILMYCFSGKSGSIATATAFIMKYKKWSFEFSVGYMMKLSPMIELPSWLFTQLQRINVDKSNTASAKNNNIDLIKAKDK